MTASGALHVLAACLALVVGALVLRRPKGTAAHVRTGRLYVGLLVVVDASALVTYEQGRPGPFHLLAVVSLGTVAAGLLLSPRRTGQRSAHAVLMLWSVAGLVAAGLAQAATAALPDAAPWATVVVTAAVCAVAAWAARAHTA